MIDAKKIADAVRAIASFYAPDDGCTNAIYNALIAIANELDPPKPKPLLADAKVGDLCKRRDGKWVQIIRIDTCHKRPYRYRDNEYGGDERGVTVAGSWICDDNGKRSFDIIATEPLAEVGTAEWAWQMMKLGNKVRNRDWNDGTYEKSLLYCQLIGETIKYNEGCSAFDVCLSDWEAPYIKNTGWQLYEEKPQPQYKVGDWVEYKGKQYRISAFGGGEMMFFENAIFALTPPYPIRKLAPSEVIVKIGCLEGTVERACAEGNKFSLNTAAGYCLIMLDALDTQTRELVESLLKAQEEK